MKNFVLTGVLVFAAIYLWSKLVTPGVQKKVSTGDGSPASNGLFQGPNIDPVSGAYTEKDNTTGAVGWPTQPIGLQ